MPDDVTIRVAHPQDEDALVALNSATWSAESSPAPRPDETWQPFARRRPADYLVAEVGGRIVGYVCMGHPTPLAASTHVTEIQGLGVIPHARGRGIARTLMSAALDTARLRGAHKVSLRVMGTNTAAHALYRSLGFAVEGHLRDEFVVSGVKVDDLLMAVHLDVDHPSTEITGGHQLQRPPHPG